MSHQLWKACKSVNANQPGNHLWRERLWQCHISVATCRYRFTKWSRERDKSDTWYDAKWPRSSWTQHQGKSAQRRVNLSIKSYGFTGGRACRKCRLSVWNERSTAKWSLHCVTEKWRGIGYQVCCYMHRLASKKMFLKRQLSAYPTIEKSRAAVKYK